MKHDTHDQGPGGEAVLPEAAGLHDLGTCGVHGVGGEGRGSDGSQDAGGDQPQAERAGNHPRRLLHRGGWWRVHWLLRGEQSRVVVGLQPTPEVIVVVVVVVV